MVSSLLNLNPLRVAPGFPPGIVQCPGLGVFRNPGWNPFDDVVRAFPEISLAIVADDIGMPFEAIQEFRVKADAFIRRGFYPKWAFFKQIHIIALICGPSTKGSLYLREYNPKLFRAQLSWDSRLSGLQSQGRGRFGFICRMCCDVFLRERSGRFGS